MFRVGFGYDSHRFDAARLLVLGGVSIPDAPGLAGHSDADAVCHAVTDAILGAIAAGDIGEHFPDDDPQWSSADSRTFLRHAIELASRANYRVANCDLTILAQRPKLSPHKPAIARSLSELLDVAPADVSVKAKTNEHMGFVGRGEGIVAMATVLLQHIEK
jgi:2-C-methyl-D-erythritol 2,4-cyclodiphosphate synthase